MNRWLQDFAYRIDIGWWVFALAGGLALVIALLKVSTQGGAGSREKPGWYVAVRMIPCIRTNKPSEKKLKKIVKEVKD